MRQFRAEKDSVTGTLDIPHGGTSNNIFTANNILIYDGEKISSTDINYENGILTVDNLEVGSLSINGVAYVWPNSESKGVLTSDENGVLSWQNISNLLDTSGDLAAGYVAYFSDKHTLTGVSEFNWDFINKRLGVGTSTPDCNLHVYNVTPSTSAQVNILKLSEAGTLGQTYQESALFKISHGGPSYYGTNLHLWVNGASNSNNIPDQHCMTWNYLGNVGIGTASPPALLSIAGGSADWNTTTPGTSVGTLHLIPGSTDNYGCAITFGASDSGSGLTGQAGIYTRTDGTFGSAMYFATTDMYSIGSKTRMTIGATGNVGVGTASPLAKFAIADVNLHPSTFGNLYVYTTDSQGIDKGGLITIGGVWSGSDHTPFAGITGKKENATSGNYAGYLSLWTTPNGVYLSERMRITSTGLVGIKRIENIQAWLEVSNGLSKTSTDANTNLFLSSNDSSNQAGLIFQLVGGASQSVRRAAISTIDQGVSWGGNITLQENGGNVGIGTYCPSIIAHIRSQSESCPGGAVAAPIGVLKLGRTGTQEYSWPESAEFRIQHANSGTVYGSRLHLYVNGASNTTDVPDQHCMTWDYLGNAGIGIINPSEYMAGCRGLAIYSSSYPAVMLNSASTQYGLWINSGDNSCGLHNSTFGANIMTFTTAGNIGIGCAPSDDRVKTQGVYNKWAHTMYGYAGAGSYGLYIDAGNNWNDYNMLCTSNNNYTFAVRGDGTVGIGCIGWTGVLSTHHHTCFPNYSALIHPKSGTPSSYWTCNAWLNNANSQWCLLDGNYLASGIQQYQGAFYFLSAPAGTSPFTFTTLATLTTTGLGIRCTPDYKFHVVESGASAWSVRIKSGSTNYDANVYLSHGGGYGAYIDPGANASSSTYALNICRSTTPYFYVRGDGNVGIGTDSPSYKLDVNGNVRVNTYAKISVNSTIPRFGRTDDSAYINCGAQTNELYLYYYVRVASLSSGTVYSDQYGTLNMSASDSRLKRNIEPIRDALSNVMKLKGVSFNWNTSMKRVNTYGDQREYGLIAQDVNSVFPELVFTGRDGYMGIHYDRVCSVLLEAIKEQQQQIDDLKAKIVAT